MTIKLKDFEIGGDKLTIIAGPCAIESQEILDKTAETLKEITSRLGINYIFKSSCLIVFNFLIYYYTTFQRKMQMISYGILHKFNECFITKPSAARRGADTPRPAADL